LEGVKMNKIEILKELKERLAIKFPTLERIILFGSQLKSDKLLWSDIDVLLIFNQDIDWRIEKKILNEIYEVELERDVVFDAKIFSKKLINTSLYQAMPFVREVLNNGVEI
jgi:predicted nucleotidyltransferase